MPFLIACLVALVATPPIGRLALRAGLVDRPGDDLKIHARPIPTVGGVAVAIAIAVAAAVTGSRPNAWIVASVTVLFVSGLVDDIKPLPAALRLVIQIGAGLLLVLGGATLPVFGVLGPVAIVVVVAACTNGVNLIDGQDGLAAGVAGFAAAGLALLAGFWGDHTSATLGIAAAGALCGFAFWNRPPARIFLGNGGAYGVGGVLAVLAISVSAADGWRSITATALCLGILMFELVFTVVRRALSGGGLSAGDRAHSYDLISKRWDSRARSTWLFWILAAAAAGIAIVVVLAPTIVAVMAFSASSVLAVAAGVDLWSDARPAGT